MIKINVKKMSNYPVSGVKIKRHLMNYLGEKGITSDCEATVAVVGRTKMLGLAKKFLSEKNTLHNVLSFTENEVHKNFVYPPKDVNYLGEIVICFPKVFEEAKKENKTLETKVLELVSHGAEHLLGNHHEI